MTRRLLPLVLFLALAGYFAPWVYHPVAGLVITGLDLGEYIKFLPVVRNGDVSVWRAGFYMPLVAISATALLYAFRYTAPGFVRILLLGLAIVAALNLVPPAWTPSRLLEPEFRVQTGSLIILLVGTGFAPFLALLPHRMTAIIASILALAGIVFPLHGFLAVLPAISALYNRTLVPSWGIWLTVASLFLLILLVWTIRDLPEQCHPASRVHEPGLPGK